MVGAHRGRSAPTWYRPSSVFFSGGLLLCLTFGLTLAGVHESFLAHDWFWFWIFVAGEIGCVVLYFLNIRSWLRWVDQSSDYSGAYEPVVSADGADTEHDYHPGEHGQP